MSKIIINCETNEVLETELSKFDKDQQKLDEKQFQAEIAEIEARETARKAILDRLGLTADELKILLG